MKYTHEELIKNGYKLTFEDHFEGDSLNPEIWNIVTLCQDGKNGKKAWRLPQNISVKDSILTISGHIEEDRYTSGMINTGRKFAYKYGYAEIYAKLPKGGPGIWPGFWTKSDYKGFKVNSEVDIFEMFGDDSYIACALHAWWNDSVYNKMHHLTYNPCDGEANAKRIEGHKMSDDWHTIGFFWSEDFVEFTVDGEPYQHIDINNPVCAPFHTPIYFIISMAFGLNVSCVNAPREDRTEPVDYKIDYIRVYQNDSGKIYGFDEEGYLLDE